MTFPEQQQQADLFVRPAIGRDVEAIGDLWIELMTYHAQLDPRFGIPPQGRVNYVRQVQRALRDESCRILVAVDGRRVIGYAYGYIGQNPPIYPLPRYGFIADLCVTQAQRRRGVGERLVREICAWFKLRGLENVQMNVAHHNPLSQAFWRKMGGTDYLDHLWMPLKGE